jgi:hypothetical protein
MICELASIMITVHMKFDCHSNLLIQTVNLYIPEMTMRTRMRIMLVALLRTKRQWALILS